MSDISLIVDNPQRDLRGLVLLAAELATRGLRTSLVPMYLVHEVFAFSPKLVVLNYVRTNNSELVARLHAAGLQVAVLDTEGGVFASLDHLFRILSSDPTTCSAIGAYCCWGAGVAEPLVQRGAFAADRVHVTGCPRFDFYAPPWRDSTDKPVSMVDLDAPVLLINGAFPIANPGYQTRAQELAMLVKTFGYDEAEVRRWQRTQDESIRGMIAMAIDLAHEFPEVRVVYRPHPFERMETYVEPFRDVFNLLLCREGTVDAWIQRSQAVIQRNCSTAIEAGLAGVPAFLPTWIPTHASVPVAEAVSIHEPTFASLVADIRLVLSNSFTPPPGIKAALDETIAKWFHAVDGCSHQRVANVLQTLLSGTELSNRRELCRDLLRGVPPNASLLEKLTRRFIGRCLDPLRPFVRAIRPSEHYLKFYKTDKYFDAIGVSRILDGLRTVPEGALRFRDVRVRPAERVLDYRIDGTTRASVVIEAHVNAA